MRINEIHSCMRSVYDDWSNFLVNPQFIRRNGEVTWPNASRFIRYPILMSDIIEMADRKQYTFQIIEDGSLIQMYYKYHGTNLISASLGYYSMSSYSESQEDIQNKEEPNEGEAMEEDSQQETHEIDGNHYYTDLPIGWIRIDFSPETGNGVLHHDCHMHLGSFPNSRFIVSGLPNPKQFVEFIISMCYPEKYKEHRLNESCCFIDAGKLASINSPKFRVEGYELYERIMHICVP